MTKHRARGWSRPAIAAVTAAAAALIPLGTAAPALAEPPTPAAVQEIAASPGDGTAAGAVEWFTSKSGSTAYEGLCEKAVENAYGTTGIWPSAIAHWEGAIKAGKAHKGSTNAPKGAFVYWNTSQYGHVGISDGKGGFYSSSVGGAIGHGGSLSYFGNYLGWSEGQVPA
ncbi:CHAP domain-containing protein [Amycolatopsis antarctica]|uniref:CHAP domain-containing protein n=1 Tax=Amycolatopsis antarctica TaxID=1854586 RepID=A0A263D6A2_9PSEU|nr:CHAP domain-containing protein [Amycolatopsis antarctica]OZM73901.1 CHAP domain-containing protein [Amycolatopsis antarctica]